MSKPDIPTTPTEEELKQLPRWARVAFAARCARRVQPLFKADWPEAPEEHVNALDAAISVGEQLATLNWPEPNVEAIRQGFEKDLAVEVKRIVSENLADLTAVERTVIEHRFGYESREKKGMTLEQVGQIIGVTKDRVRQIQNKAMDKIRTTLEESYFGNKPDKVEHEAIVEAANRAASDAYAAVDVTVPPNAAGYAANAASYTASMANEIAGSSLASTAAAVGVAAYNAHTDCAAPIRRDYDLLLAASNALGWTDTTPVPPEFFGPMWPQGEPEGWPKPEHDEDETATPKELIIEIDVPENATREEVLTKIRELARQANALHRAHGGKGLRVEDIDIEHEARVHEGVAS